jgi:hypothetical protein
MGQLILKLFLPSVLLLGLPLLGIALIGEPLAPFLTFPPRTYFVSHAPFSWSHFAFVAVLAFILIITLIWLVRRDLVSKQPAAASAPAGRWPWWGWLGVATLAISWILAWTRFPWFADLQPHTFVPLWLSYIVTINAWTYFRSGQCLLRNRPGYLAMLFPLSAVFWWYFEYLNRFVASWHYVGVEDFSAMRYTLHATLAFSTVLPAVLSTVEWLNSMLRPPPTAVAIHLSRHQSQTLSIIVLVVSVMALTGLGIWPDYVFGFVWIAPALLLLAFQGLVGEPVLVNQLRTRGWQTIYLPALAALQCGFFWEMWNYYSQAKWLYSIPFVQRFSIFEMPILGYAGYLPFGIQCIVIASLIRRTD